MGRPHQLLHGQARQQAADAARTLGRASGRTVWIVLRPRSDRYLEVALAAGLVTGASALGLLLYLPFSFATDWVLADVGGAALLGSALCLLSPHVLRLILPARLAHQRVHAAACRLFVEHLAAKGSLGPSMLLFLSLAERRAEVVSAPHLAALDGPRAAGALSKLEDALHHRSHPERFTEALSELTRLIGPTDQLAPRAPAGGLDDEGSAA